MLAIIVTQRAAAVKFSSSIHISQPTCIFQQQALHGQCCQVSAGHFEPLPPVRLLQRIINCQRHHMPPSRRVHQVCNARVRAAVQVSTHKSLVACPNHLQLIGLRCAE